MKCEINLVRYTKNPLLGGRTKIFYSMDFHGCPDCMHHIGYLDEYPEVSEEIIMKVHENSSDGLCGDTILLFSRTSGSQYQTKIPLDEISDFKELLKSKLGTVKYEIKMIQD